MQKIETRNGTLVFIEVPENAVKIILNDFAYDDTSRSYVVYELPRLESQRLEDGIVYELLGEVTKEGITFYCEPYLHKFKYSESKQEIEQRFMTEMFLHFIELREGYKFVVLKEKSQ